MPDHALHWEALLALETYATQRLQPDLAQAQLLGSWPCPDLFNRTGKTERLVAVRRDLGSYAHQILLVSDSVRDSYELYSAFPVVLTGIEHRLRIESFMPWDEDGVEGCVQASPVTEPDDRAMRPMTVFVNDYLAASGTQSPPAVIKVRLSALLCSLAREPLAEDVPTGDQHFSGTVLKVERVGPLRCEHYLIRLQTLLAGSQTTVLPLLASRRILGERLPRVGQRLSGTLWLQAYFSPSLLGSATLPGTAGKTGILFS